MRRVYVVDRRKLGIVGLVLVLALASWATWQVSMHTVNKAAFSQNDIPEISINSIALSPKTVTRDLTYEGIPFLAQQLFQGKDFTATVSLQNNSDKTVQNIPVEVTLYLEGQNPVKRTGMLREITPGSVVNLNFGRFSVLGDANGNNANAGLHQLQVRILANPQGGVNLGNERSMLFFVDSKVK
ncbi:MAG: hypothetical protein M0Z55_06880 [Peptococcaceae bacterium]|nr:hypothetical protein [Peptococcaceae bacterium]